MSPSWGWWQSIGQAQELGMLKDYWTSTPTNRRSTMTHSSTLIAKNRNRTHDRSQQGRYPPAAGWPPSLIRADADTHAIQLLHVLDPEFRAIRQASGRLELLRNIEAIASGRSRLIAGSKISTGLHPSTQERR